MSQESWGFSLLKRNEHKLHQGELRCCEILLALAKQGATGVPFHFLILQSVPQLGLWILSGTMCLQFPRTLLPTTPNHYSSDYALGQRQRSHPNHQHGSMRPPLPDLDLSLVYIIKCNQHTLLTGHTASLFYIILGLLFKNRLV